MFLSAAIAITVLRSASSHGPPEETFGRPIQLKRIAAYVEVGSVETAGQGEAAFLDWIRGNPMLTNRGSVEVARSDGEVIFVSDTNGQLVEARSGHSAPLPFTISRAEGDYQVSVLPANFGRFGTVQRTIVRAAFQPQVVWLLLLVAIPLSVGLSMVIARYLVSPLRVFERAGVQLASGDLAVRVSPELGNRGDEIADFASTFDQMAARIEGLVQAHQRLLRDVSHDLRTPLARVLAAASLVRKATDGVAVGEFDRIEREVSLLDGMISRLLTYARLDAGDGALNVTKIRLDSLVVEIVDESLIEVEADDRPIAIDIRAPCTVNGDLQLLTSCIENVLRNALHHTPPHCPVNIELNCAHGMCVLTVRDHGPGVPEDDLLHLFKPFYQTDPARAPQFSGYGIGLAIAYKAMELHDGSIEAKNAADGGLLVTITLPLLR